MKVKLIIISIILLLVMVFACGCIPLMEKLGILTPPEEEQLSPEKGGPPDGLVKVLIGFKQKPGPAEQAVVKGVGGQIKYTYNLIPAIAAAIPEVAIEALKKNPNITNIELDSEVYALDTELDNSWGVKRIGAGFVHDDGNNGEGIKIAIIDTGIDRDHPDLDGNLVGGVNFVSKPSWRTPDPNNWDDDNGHGTHVAGIIAAEDNDTGVVGVAPGAALYALKVLDRTGSGYVSDVVAAIQWATVNDIQVINMSLGGGASITLEAACLLAYYQDGLILVAAAGNGGSVIYPAAYDSVIAVSATDNADKLASFSSIGPEVELAAPGVNIYSTYKDGGYATMSGTSMASPHVAGTAALVIAAGILDVRTQLQTTADDLGDSGRDQQYGFGLVDADEAASAQPPPPNEPPIVSITNPADGFTFDSGAEILFAGKASDLEDGDLTSYLVWTSSIDGSIGTGDNFYKTLSDGTHTITIEVTDSGGETGSAYIGITVGTPITDNMHVKSIEMSSQTAGINVNAIATVTIVDKISTSVEGATVYGHWRGATSDVDSGVTNASGIVSLESNKVKKPKSGTIFTFTVDNVSKVGWTYDPGANIETSDSITVE